MADFISLKEAARSLGMSVRGIKDALKDLEIEPSREGLQQQITAQEFERIRKIREFTTRRSEA